MFACNVCSGSDPTSDTVKVDMSKLSAGKENVQPLRIQNANQEAEKEEKEKRRAQEKLKPAALQQQEKEAEERRQAEEHARRKREEEEARRLQAEQAAVERAAAAERAAAEAAAKAKEEQVHAEAQKAAAERARQEREAAERTARAEAQRLEEKRLAQEQVDAWCKSNGFGDKNAKKKSFMSGSRYPLHEAVAKGNEEMVGFLVQVGADKTLKNSKGLTPEDVAKKMNKGGAMDGILAMLR